MKTIVSRLSFTLALVTLIGMVGCKKKSEPAAEQAQPSTAAGQKSSFDAVTAHLDRGGDLYVYVGTERCLQGAAAKVASWHQLLSGLPDMQAADRENLERGLNVLTNLIGNSGIQDVRGFGMSSVLRDNGLYHSKAMLYHAKGAGSGFLWNLFGRDSHPMKGLDLLPANTGMAVFSDLDAALLWSALSNQVAQSGWPQADQMLGKLPEAFQKATGLEWQKVVNSLGGEFGFAFTLDESKTVSIPLPQDQRLEFAEPALMIVAAVKDDTIFNRIDEALKKTGQQIFQTDKPNLKMRTLPVPLPLPMQLGLTVAMSEGYLFIASTDAIVQQALAVKAGQKPGLKSTDEFKRLAKDIPQQGNNFSFVSQRFSQTITRVQRQAMQMAPGGAPPQVKLFQNLLTGGEPSFYYAVGGNSPEGWVWAANGNQAPSKFIAAAAVVPAAIGAGVALPAIAKAKARAASAREQSSPPPQQ